MKNSLIIFISGVIGALISRFHGGGYFGARKAVRNTLWAFPFAFAVFINAEFGFLINVGLSVASFIMCYVGKTLGHGRGISLPYPLRGQPERIEVFTLWALPYLNVYSYKCLILALSGFLAVSGGFLLGHPYILLIALGGLLKAPAYMIGWEVSKEGTVVGEYLTGFFAFSALTIAMVS